MSLQKKKINQAPIAVCYGMLGKGSSSVLRDLVDSVTELPLLKQELPEGSVSSDLFLRVLPINLEICFLTVLPECLQALSR